MVNIHKEYLIDEKGEKKAVLPSYSEWVEILEGLEELEDIRAYDKTKTELLSTNQKFPPNIFLYIAKIKFVCCSITG